MASSSTSLPPDAPSLQVSGGCSGNTITFTVPGKYAVEFSLAKMWEMSGWWDLSVNPTINLADSNTNGLGYTAWHSDFSVYSAGLWIGWDHPATNPACTLLDSSPLGAQLRTTRNLPSLLVTTTYVLSATGRIHSYLEVTNTSGGSYTYQDFQWANVSLNDNALSWSIPPQLGTGFLSNRFYALGSNGSSLVAVSERGNLSRSNASAIADTDTQAFAGSITLFFAPQSAQKQGTLTSSVPGNTLLEAWTMQLWPPNRTPQDATELEADWTTTQVDLLSLLGLTAPGGSGASGYDIPTGCYRLVKDPTANTQLRVALDATQKRHAPCFILDNFNAPQWPQWHIELNGETLASSADSVRNHGMAQMNANRLDFLYLGDIPAGASSAERTFNIFAF